jgi:hypothetical protein
VACRAGTATNGGQGVMWLASLWCRLFGRTCSVVRPASKDIIEEMRAHSKKVEAETTAIREGRGEIIEGVFLPRVNKEHHRNAH